jgi:hypothetical protein
VAQSTKMAAPTPISTRRRRRGSRLQRKRDGEVVETEMVLVLSVFRRHMAVVSGGRMPRSELPRQAARAGAVSLEGVWNDDA